MVKTIDEGDKTREEAERKSELVRIAEEVLGSDSGLSLNIIKGHGSFILERTRDRTNYFIVVKDNNQILVYGNVQSEADKVAKAYEVSGKGDYTVRLIE